MGGDTNVSNNIVTKCMYNNPITTRPKNGWQEGGSWLDVSRKAPGHNSIYYVIHNTDN